MYTYIHNIYCVETPLVVILSSVRHLEYSRHEIAT